METTDLTVSTETKQKGSLFIKSVIIVVMALGLWLPTNLILELVKERAGRQQEAVEDISFKWAGKQSVAPPVLILPYYEKARFEGVKKMLYIYPDKCEFISDVLPETRYRGIYEVPVYRSKVSLKGNFNPVVLAEKGITADNVLWEDAKIFFKVQDPVKGINEDIILSMDQRNYSFRNQTEQAGSFYKAFETDLPFTAADLEKPHHFQMEFSLNGSSQIMFHPIARENSIQIRSSWSDPAFTGIKIPDTRQVSDSGFTANWKFVNRTVPQVAEHASFDWNSMAIGVDFIIPVDNYDKTERSVKYAILVIILTFAAFFLIETIYKKPLHLIQYGLAGFALVLFYTLLLSISEYTGFNIAYLVSGVATIGLISWFVGGIMKSTKLALFISLVLFVVYSYIFTLIQLEDYSLLMGSIGLFVALAIIMFFSRKLQWDQPKILSNI